MCPEATGPKSFNIYEFSRGLCILTDFSCGKIKPWVAKKINPALKGNWKRSLVHGTPLERRRHRNLGAEIKVAILNYGASGKSNSWHATVSLPGQRHNAPLHFVKCYSRNSQKQAYCGSFERFETGALQRNVCKHMIFYIE